MEDPASASLEELAARARSPRLGQGSPLPPVDAAHTVPTRRQGVSGAVSQLSWAEVHLRIPCFCLSPSPRHQEPSALLREIA